MRCGTFSSPKNELWIWKVYCSDAGQLIALKCGGSDQTTFHGLIKGLKKWKVWFYCTDKWKVYPLEPGEN